MSVLIETSAGDLVIDLLVDHAPKLCEKYVFFASVPCSHNLFPLLTQRQSFLKLCKIKYYNFSPVHSIQNSFSFTTGDPLGPLSTVSDGGSSIWGLLSSRPSDKTFPALFHPKLKHAEAGTVSMATVAADPSDPDAPRFAASQFLITLGADTDYLDGKAAVFAKVVEGFDVLEKINTAIVDEHGHPLVDIRILHAIILDDPYPDPPTLVVPPSSPEPTRAQLATVRIADEAALRADDGLDDETLEKRRRAREAQAQALTLEMMGDLPFAEVRPPENILFVCQLNPVTRDEDLELIFGRFGTIASCEVVRDRKTGDSLQYAFIEFEEKEACERAYFKMQEVLIDDRRIHVDFSQSVSKLSAAWRQGENQKRRVKASGNRVGWGGVDELERKRQYREEVVEERDDGYRIVHGARKKDRSLSPRRDERRDEQRRHERGGEKGGQYHDGRERRGDEHKRGRDRSRDRRRDRSRDHGRRDRYRDDRDDRITDRR